ncbi:hypothetical protein BHE74_00040598 [Ensete ventricosum]|nr:hypothetical protein GW17_00020302 [Ensete ventricosum]RWW52949.1 hypothetical protein BHE74_00040598 [Ensete ventricosum]RZS01841.1 hypothetical protein BHM03_00031781 [Ensete ventricosum]
MACETLSNIGAAITGAETWEFWISWKVTELFEIDAGDSSQDVDLGSNMSPAVAQLKLPATSHCYSCLLGTDLPWNSPFPVYYLSSWEVLLLATVSKKIVSEEANTRLQRREVYTWPPQFYDSGRGIICHQYVRGGGVDPTRIMHHV